MLGIYSINLPNPSRTRPVDNSMVLIWLMSDAAGGGVVIGDTAAFFWVEAFTRVGPLVVVVLVIFGGLAEVLLLLFKFT